MIALQGHYIQNIDAVVLFLQGENPTVSLSNAFLTFLDFFWAGFVAWMVAKVVGVFELCAHSEHKRNQRRSKRRNAGFTSTLVAFMRQFNSKIKILRKWQIMTYQLLT